MPDSANFALHRPELEGALQRGEAKLDALMHGAVQRWTAGLTIIQADQRHDYVYRLRRGWTGRVRTLPDGRSQYILIFLPGDLFAVKSMFVARHTDEVQTLSNVEVERIDYKVLREAYDRDSDIALRCTWQVIEEERRLHNWIVGLGRGSAEERFALLITDFRGRLILSGVIPPDAQSYFLPMTQEQMADHLGISAVHLNRVLRSLRTNGVIALRGKMLTILQPESLRELAEPLLDTYERSTPAYINRS